MSAESSQQSGRYLSMTPYRKADLFGGVGVVTIYNLLGARHVAPFEAVLSCALEAGGRVGAHVQQTAHELLIVSSGVGGAEVDGSPQQISAGSVVHIPHGRSLSLTNHSESEPLCYLLVKSTGGAP